MDTSYLSQQVNTIIGQLHGLFDEIGVPSHDRESREAEVFAALSETLNGQLRKVTAEKNEMIDQAEKIRTTIRQMEGSLDDTKARRDDEYDDEDEIQVTFPLTRCLQVLKEKQMQISRLHRERFEQVKKLVEALQSYSSHLEPTFVTLPLPPSTSSTSAPPPTFDLSPTYVDKLDQEFTRVYEEYVRRVTSVRTLSAEIIQLWAELGVPQAQTDSSIVKHYRDSPEQLGLHSADLQRLRVRHAKLVDEKQSREKRLANLRTQVDALWQKLSIDEAETKGFLNQNRGCGVRQINEFEDELARLTALKHENLHLFVEDARYKLQELWDSLYFSEDEMLEFTPAFSDVYSDALLEAHEGEIDRLEALKEERTPILGLVERHRTLVSEREELKASSQDASRLMMRGQKGEKRDPTRLLREEKMRKRIAKELPKVGAELKKLLVQWEDEYGRPFEVVGERYLDCVEAELGGRPAGAGGARAKTPAGPPAKQQAPKSVAQGLQRTQSRAGNVPSRTGAKTPVAGGTLKRGAANPVAQQSQAQASRAGAASPTRAGAVSPSRIARPPLGNMKTGSNSPSRPRAATAAAPASRQQYQDTGLHRSESQRSDNHHGTTTTASASQSSLMRAPPPKMRALGQVPELDTPVNNYRNVGLHSSVGIVRQVEPEDVYLDQHAMPPPARPMSRQQQQQQHHNQDRHQDRVERERDIAAAQVYAQSRQQQQRERGQQQKDRDYHGSEGYSQDSSSAYSSQDSYPTFSSAEGSRNTSITSSKSGNYMVPASSTLQTLPERGNRQASDATASTGGLASGSENWETYETEGSEEGGEEEFYTRGRDNAGYYHHAQSHHEQARSHGGAKYGAGHAQSMREREYYLQQQRLHEQQGQMGRSHGGGIKRLRGGVPLGTEGREVVVVDGDGNRVVSANGSEWTDEDAF